MDRPRIALVCPDASLKMVAARAFDDAPSDWDVTLHDDVPADADLVVTVGESAKATGDLWLDPARPHDVVEEVRSLLDASTCRVVAVVGAAGGCGATSIALHLAAATTGSSCLVDLQARPSCARRLGIDPGELADAAAPVPVPGGSRLLAARAPLAPARLDALRRDFERVVLDAPRDFIAEVRDHCDAVVLVMAPTLVAAASAAGLLVELGDTPVAVVTNRLGPGGETTRADLRRILGHRITLELPCSRGLRDAEDDCRLLTSAWSPWLYRIRRLSAALAS